MDAPFIHETAIVDGGVTLGAGVRVWHFSHVMGGASIGCGSSLGQNTHVAQGVQVGERVKIQNNVSIYEGVTIDDEVFIGPSVVFTNVGRPRAFVDKKSALESTRVGRGATIGAGAVIVCGNDIGAHAFVGAGAVVTRDVAPHSLVVGNPARHIGWVSRCGEKLSNGPFATCPSSGEVYEIDQDGCRLRSSAKGSEPVPFADLSRLDAPLQRDLKQAFKRVLASGKYVLGEEVEAFEREAADKVQARFAVGVSSGSDALLVSLMALGIGPGDEVVTSPYSFFATAEAILRIGAKPVFVDIEPNGFNIDADQIADRVSKRTRAILPVHLFGALCDAKVFALAKSLGIPVIEDAAQSFGARSSEGFAGALGSAGCFSFFPTKGLGALGDGGLVTTSDEALAARIRALRSHGSSERYRHTTVGGNFRLDALQAAFLRTKLPRIDLWTRIRTAHSRLYDEALAPLVGAKGLALHPNQEGDVRSQYLIRTKHRDALRTSLANAGIATEISYPTPLHLQPGLSHLALREGAFPNAERAACDSLALPIHASIRRGEIERVAQAVLRFFDH